MSSSSLEGVKQRLSGTGSVNGVTTFGGLAGGTLGELSDYHCCKPEGLAGGMPAMREMCSLLSCQLEDCTFGRPGGGGGTRGGQQGWDWELAPREPVSASWWLLEGGQGPAWASHFR